MKYVEEKSPAGYSFRLFPESAQMIVFDCRGKTVDLNGNPSGGIQKIPDIFLTGGKFLLKTELYREYSVLKVKNGKLIVPWTDRFSFKNMYFFMPVPFKLDMIPVRMISFSGVSELMKTVKDGSKIERILLDQTVQEKDIEIILRRYTVQEVFRTGNEQKTAVSHNSVSVSGGNPVFTACEYTRNRNMEGLKSVLENGGLTITDLDCISEVFDSVYKNDSDEDKSGPESSENMKKYLIFCSAVKRRDMQMVTGCTAGDPSPVFLGFCRRIVKNEQALLPAADTAGKIFLEAAETSVINNSASHNTENI